MATLYHRYGSWWAIFTVNYKQKWIKIGKMSKTSAKAVLRKLEEDYEKRRFKIVEDRLILFKDYASEYLNFSKANKALKTYIRDDTSTKNLLPAFGDIYLPRITTQSIEQYKIKRIEHVKPRTVNIELRCLSHMLNKAVEWGYIGASPFKGIKLFSYKKKPPRFLTKEESKRLMDYSTPWLKPMVIVMLNTGIREGERARLKFEDVDFKRKIILIHSSKGGGHRPIPMNENVRDTLKWLKDNYVTKTNKITKRTEAQMEYVFCDEDGSPVLSIRNALSNACRKAGIKGVSAHTLRHTFASHLVMSGVDLRTVQRLMGHTSIATTMVYAHLTEDHLARSVEKLLWVDKY
ncbi:tyrosine-type recombinase/integrase [Desulfobacterota bacterium AH_259_B03_O07]|nr:tyrosine-type recombinase/integrase [Desulfobacterota bacterium AH_259_B03_O07]